MNTNEILERHKIYVESFGENGSKANLYGVDLREVDLREADLRGANLRGANLREANLP